MSYEIYYTSAPEGLKRGTGGFSTVAATDNIPKALWDRLETLSAYRHLTGVGSGDGVNPVSFAHWILTVTGKTHHVLSRICDSGVDHTQRSNAFAHHVVLETAEMEAAPGGPAWMLQETALMASAWDGRVGTLARNALPVGDGGGPQMCRAWAQATGDAGWGGHLADLFAKSPTRPVCILFSPGQEILPLMAEAIALLPAAARWNVTFNTYFTSMPTSATCLWRCCAVGTQAADVGQRYAANGLLLNLVDPSRLPTVPDGPYVKVARTGRSAEVLRVPANRPAVTKAPLQAAVKAGTVPVLPIDAEDLADEKRRESLLGLDDDTRVSPSLAADAEAEAEGAPLDLAPSPKARAALSPRRIARHAEDAFEEAERDAATAARRRRQQVMALFYLALGAIGIGSILMIAALKHGAPPPETPHVQAPAPAPTVDIPPLPTVSANVDAAPLAVTTARVRNDPPPAPAPRVAATPAPVTVYPERVALRTALEKPNILTGIGDRSQTLLARAADIDPQRVTGLRFVMPVSAKAGESVASNSASYKSDALGTFSVRSQMINARPAVVLFWKNAQENGMPSELGSLQWDAGKSSLDVQWHASLLLKYPGMFSLVYWVMQNSELELQSTREAKQRLTFKPVAIPTVNFAAAQSDIAWPVDLPGDVIVVAPADLGDGWHAERYFDWASKDAATRTPENALQVIKFKKGSALSVADALFTVTFHPGLRKVECNFDRQVRDHQQDLQRFESELRAIENQPDDFKQQEKKPETVALVDAYKQAMAGYNAFTKFDLSFEMPDGVRLATVHFERPAKDQGK